MSYRGLTDNSLSNHVFYSSTDFVLIKYSWMNFPITDSRYKFQAEWLHRSMIVFLNNNPYGTPVNGQLFSLFPGFLMFMLALLFLLYSLLYIDSWEIMPICFGAVSIQRVQWEHYQKRFNHSRGFLSLQSCSMFILRRKTPTQ